MKTNPPKAFSQPTRLDRVINRRWIATLVMTLALALMLGTSGFQTYWSKERRLIAAADEIVVALKAYSNASPGTAKEFPLELTDLMRDPRMLANKSYLRVLPVDPINQKSYLRVLPVDPINQKQDWGVVRNKDHQVIGVHSLSNDAPTLFATLFSFRGGEKYSDWKFLAE